MRVLVTGSRKWARPGLVHLALEAVFSMAMEAGEVLTVIHGDCPTGADAHADEWAKRLRRQGLPVEIESYPADWKGPRKRGAGYARNAEMVKLGADLCLAFILDESDGATHCSGLAEQAGIETKYYRLETRMAAELSRTPVLKPQPYKRVEEEVTFRGIRIQWSNFEGEERQFNAEGKRNFAIPLEEPEAIKLYEAGWNVKERIFDDGTHRYHLQVTVNMKGKRPPRIFLITMSKNRRVQLDEETARMVDFLEFDKIDVTIRPYNWEVNGKRGVGAYLKIFMGVLHEDELELEYAHIPILGQEDEEHGVLLESFVDASVEDDSGWIPDDEEERKAIAA